MPLPIGMNSHTEPRAMLPSVLTFFRAFPENVATVHTVRPVPFWAHSTPDTGVIFINNSTEKLGVL